MVGIYSPLQIFNFTAIYLRRLKVMPKGYEKMRDALKKKMLQKGLTPAKADKEAKRIAAATWNKKHPKNPVTSKPHKKK